MKITAVLFDMDGVLYDSMPLHAKAWARSFNEYGVKISAKSVYEAEGMTEMEAAVFIARSAKLNLPQTDINKIIVKKNRFYDKFPRPRLIKGAKSLIRYLQKYDYGICVVTGSSQGKTLARLKKDFGIERHTVVTGKDVRRGKPHPEPFLKALKKLKVPAKFAVVIENAPLGIESAKRAKIKCIALNTGPFQKRELIKRGASFVVKDCAELLKLFGKIKSF